MANAIDVLLSLLIPGLVLLHLLVAPYTKVEESFNIQAIHDILVYGIPNPLASDAAEYIQTHYDHATFPGSVPRTFVGATVLAGIVRPFISLLDNPEQIQFLVRAVLGLVNAWALLRFRSAVDTAYGRTAGRFYVLFIASQFHVLFYASRTLPNMLAFPLTTEASRAFLLSVSTSAIGKSASRRRRLSLYLFAVGAIIFRSELAILMLAIAATYALTSRLSLFQELIPALVAAGLIALPATLGLDTLLWLPRLPSTVTLPWQATWSFPIWPELQGFLFNAISGHSSEWGISPWHWYMTSALPRILLNPLLYIVCIPLAISLPSTRRITTIALLPVALYTALYSLLPHKELRFILYTAPLLLAPAAGGAAYLHTRRAKSLLYRAASLAILLSVPASFLVSSSLLALSAANYPGAAALGVLHTLPPGRAHLTNLALQSGVTRFLQRPGWVYDKSDGRLRDTAFWAEMEYAVVEDPRLAIGDWDVVGAVEGYAGLGIRLPSHDETEESTAELVEGNREVLVPFHLLPSATLVDKGQDLLRGMAERYTKGFWPHVKLRRALYILQRGETPV